MKKPLMRALSGMAVAFALATGSVAVADEETMAQLAELKPEGFPSETIEITVVYPAGGGMDINARILARAFERLTGDSVVVNNRTGGAGLVGHTYLATQAPSDGHTVGVIASLVFADAMLRSDGAWSTDDLDPIAYLNSDGLLLVVNAQGPMADISMADILAKAKAEPDTIRVTNVPGSMYEYMIEQLEAETGAKFLKVPFQGGAPGIAALLGNNVDLGIAFLGEVRSHLEGDRVKAIAVSGSERSAFVDAPTLNEVLGQDNVVWQATRWVTLPAGVPEDRKAYLAAAFIAAAADPETQEEFRNLGATANTSFDTPEAVAAHVNRLSDLETTFFQETGRLPN
jgi:tripartite-type tricarboxylate transporter receptor subunit TctC